MARTKKTDVDAIIEDVATTKETKKTTTKAKAETKVEVDTEKEELKKQNEQMAEMLKQMQAQLEEMKNSQKVQVVQTVGSSGKKVKVMNLAQCPVNVSTEGDGQGIVKTFKKYGDVLTIKFDVLSDMVANYPNTFTKGYLRILDNDVVDELGLTDDYADFYTKEILDEVISLQTDGAVELFINMDETMRETTAREMAINLKNGQIYDYNKLHRIEEETGIDIEKLSKNENVDIKM